MSDNEIMATIEVRITKKYGPDIEPRHVVNWIVADGYLMEGEFTGFKSGACSRHSNPEECDDVTLDSEYLAQIMTADLDQ